MRRSPILLRLLSAVSLGVLSLLAPAAEPAAGVVQLVQQTSRPAAPGTAAASGVRPVIRRFRDCADCPEMFVLPGGSFEMGSLDGDSDEKPVHRVTVASFAIGRTEVTQAQWRAVMESNPSHFDDCESCPVETVSWDDVQEFLHRLNAKTDQQYRLPTNAEWEYAGRAGAPYEYCGGDDAAPVAWYSRNSQDRTHPVGGLQPNAFGLVDMSGNVLEWVEDCWNDDYLGAPTDGTAWLSGDCRRRVVRGGSWTDRAKHIRAFSRFWYAGNLAFSYAGFRVAKSEPGKP